MSKRESQNLKLKFNDTDNLHVSSVKDNLLWLARLMAVIKNIISKFIRNVYIQKKKKYPRKFSEGKKT